MNKESITFDDVFLIWLNAEVNQIEGQDILPLAVKKGFTSIAEWRLNTALRLGMDKKAWHIETIEDPATVLPKIIIGPYQGWSQFLSNKLSTSFEQALEISEFFEWCKTHNRIIPISKNFPTGTTIILFRKSNGDLISIEGGHRICAAAFAEKIKEPIDFGSRTVQAAIANVSDEEISNLIDFLKQGVFKQA